MEFIDKYCNVNNEYSKKIKSSKYTEGSKVLNKVSGYKDICEIFLKNNEYEYQLLSSEEKENYVYQKKLNIAALDGFDKNKYISKFSKNLISRGLQEKNSLSSILYLNIIYNCNCIIFNADTNKYYKTGLTEDNLFFCEFKNNSWFSKDLVQNIEYSDLNDLNNILNFDISTTMVFKGVLKSLASYKIDELRSMASELNIETQKNGKNKLKKTLYDEINLKKILDSI